MEPLAVGVIALLGALGLAGLALTIFVAYDRTKPPASDLDVVGSFSRRSKRTSQLSAKRANRWMLAGLFIFVGAAGLLIGMLLLSMLFKP
jgi:hypothetical protein